MQICLKLSKSGFNKKQGIPDTMLMPFYPFPTINLNTFMGQIIIECRLASNF